MHKETHKTRIIAICLLEVDGKQAKSKRKQIFNPSISGSQKVSFSCVNNFSIQQCSFQQLISCHKVISEAQVTNESFLRNQVTSSFKAAVKTSFFDPQMINYESL